MEKDITVIGNSVVDILASGIDISLIRSGSQPADEIKTSFGGDGLNEVAILARFGKKVEIITKIGKDDAGRDIMEFFGENGILFPNIRADHTVSTSVNIVLVDKKAERYFITNPRDVIP